MNKIKQKIFIVMLLMCFFNFGSVSHAAFNFIPQSTYGDGKAYTTTAPPPFVHYYFDYSGSGYCTGSGCALSSHIDMNYTVDTNPLQACKDAALASGLSDTLDTYCVYERDHFKSNYFDPIGICIAMSCTGPRTLHNNGDFRFAYIYQTPPVQTTKAALVSRANSWYATWVFPSMYIANHAFSWPYYLSLAPVWRDPPYAPDPAYPIPPVPADVDVCGGVNADALLPIYSDATGQGPSYDRGWNMINPFMTAFYEIEGGGYTSIFTKTLDDRTCSVFHHSGASATPVATLSALPPTIVSGGTSLLTWSCSNSSTSAVIDNGVGVVTPANAGSIAVMPATTTTYKVTCTNAAGSSSANAIVTVTAAPLDLVALTGLPTTATAGISQTYTGTVTNNGSSSTGAGFTTLLQICDAGCTSYNSRTTVATGALAASASTGVSKADTITGAGTYYYRFCADNDTSWLGTIVESDETNNCGGWSSIIVSAGVGSISSCTISNPSPTVGVPVTYTATLSGSAVPPFTWSPSLPSACINGTGNTNTCTFLSNGIYSMDVSAVNASSVSCTPLTVSVGCAAGSAPTITATPARVKQGNTSTITWTASPSINSSCVLSGPGINQTYPATSCVVTPAPVVTPPITTQSVYTIVCDGVAKAQAIVNVVPKFIEI